MNMQQNSFNPPYDNPETLIIQDFESQDWKFCQCNFLYVYCFHDFILDYLMLCCQHKLSLQAEYFKFL